VEESCAIVTTGSKPWQLALQSEKVYREWKKRGPAAGCGIASSRLGSR